MPPLSIAGALLAICLLVAPGVAPAADPPRKPAPPAQPVKSQNCGELPRGSKAYKDCLAAQAQRDTTLQPAIKPAFSSR